MNNSVFHVWLLTAWTNLLSWFGFEAQKLASFLYPVFKNTKDLVGKDFLHDVIALIPIITPFLLPDGEGIEAAEVAAKELLLPLIAKQGAELAQTDINILANGLVAQAQSAIAASA